LVGGGGFAKAGATAAAAKALARKKHARLFLILSPPLPLHEANSSSSIDVWGALTRFEAFEDP